jgi:hypothetical protein
MPLFQTITDPIKDAEIVRRRTHGMIEVVDGLFARIVLRPLPKMISIPEVWLLGQWKHRHQPGDRVRLYYDQPWRFPNFLTAKYAESARNTSLRSIDRAMAVLDEIARIKRSDALLCDATNSRITADVARRWGWEPHCQSGWRRHFIKRFYGVYPTRPDWLPANSSCKTE